MPRRSTRRDFLQNAAALSSVVWVSGAPPLRANSPNEKLNIGSIGVGGRGHGDMRRVATENIVAICDVDEQRLEVATEVAPKAKKYIDYRELLQQENLDAVTIGTPDHHHAPAAMRALRRGLHVYCEKPLTHTVREARLLAETAAEKGLATQMGTQNHQHPGYVKAVEMIQGGVIGNVHEVHVITDRPGTFWKQGLTVPTDKHEVPEHFHWDLWLGPAQDRDFHPVYAPRSWRGWWDFGCGAIGDMAIHLMDPSFWALDLGGPVKVTSTGPEVLPDAGPTSMISTFEFGQRGKLAPCKVVWYEGEAGTPEEYKDLLPMNGSLFIGDQGMISVQHGQAPVLHQGGEVQNQEIAEEFSDRHQHQQWIDACKTGSATGSNFGYAGPFTETVLLGNVAYRVGKPIEYDPATMKVTNVPEANALLDKEYRVGWEV